MMLHQAIATPHFPGHFLITFLITKTPEFPGEWVRCAKAANRLSLHNLNLGDGLEVLLN